MAFGLLQAALARVSNLFQIFSVASHRKKCSLVNDMAGDMDRQGQAVHLTKQLTESFRICSGGSEEPVMEESVSHNPELCLLPRLANASVSDNPELCLLPRLPNANLQAVKRERAHHFGCTITLKAFKASLLSQRKDSYKILNQGVRGDETSRCRRRGLRTRLTNCIRIDKDLEISNVRVRQVLYYA